jgi:hypothetical protein
MYVLEETQDRLYYTIYKKEPSSNRVPSKLTALVCTIIPYKNQPRRSVETLGLAGYGTVNRRIVFYCGCIIHW